MERIRIPNDATYSPLPLLDIAVAAPLAARLLLGVTPVGRAIQMAAIGVYAASAIQDWIERTGVRKIDFLKEFGADIKHLREMPREAREAEVRQLTERLNDLYTPRRIARSELAVEVDRHLTDYIASITGQQVETSTEVRSFSLAKVLFPFAVGACDFISGDVTIFRDTGVLEPHIITHEFAHRKGYFKELEAQALAYLALTTSTEPVLLQSALAKRFYRQLRILSGDEPDRFREGVQHSGLRSELAEQLLALGPALAPEGALKTIYDERMKLTGQNGLSDYDRGFTNLLYTFERSPRARRTPPPAGRVHTREAN